jgi:hypothetical protein
MTYVVQQPVTDGLLLYNTLTCSMVLLQPDEAADLTAQRELIDRWFLVPEDHDDRKLCRQVRQMVALLKPAAKTITFDPTVLNGFSIEKATLLTDGPDGLTPQQAPLKLDKKKRVTLKLLPQCAAVIY